MVMHTIESLRAHVADSVSGAFKRAFGLEPESAITLEYPPVQRDGAWLGDFGVVCFPFAKKLRMPPLQIASQLAASLSADACISEVSAVGPYLNITVHADVLFSVACQEAISSGDVFGVSKHGHGKRVMVEYLSPNTNKPLHLGHVRNGALGMAISNLLAATGHTVIRANLINDRGVHICKSMTAYKQWGEGQTPESKGVKGDHFVGDFYVMFEQEFEWEWRKHLESHPEIQALSGDELDKSQKAFFGRSVVGAEAQQMLADWEAGDQDVRALWERMNAWVYSGFDQTYKRYGFLFDTFYYESDTYLLGRDIVQDGLVRGILSRLVDGSVVAHLSVDEFGRDKGGGQKRTVLQRPDGTSLYMTQDLGTAVRKFEEHGLNVSVYVVGNEQDHHFKALFAILGMLGYQWSSNCHHLSYGMVNLPEGKMKSREGKVVDADELALEMTEMALSVIREQEQDRESGEPLTDEEIRKRAASIGLAAIKFYLLRVAPTQAIRFDPKESLSFDGVTGPYCQYAYARCSSILRRAADGPSVHTDADFSLLGNTEERYVLRCVSATPEMIQRSAELMNPSMLASHVYETARAFSRLYQQHRILDRDSAPALIAARVQLVAATAVALKQGLTLLGIDVLDEM